MSFENDLHDWYIDGIIMERSGMSGPSEITLFVRFYDGARKKIRFLGATRCFLDDFLVQNVIFEAKIISRDEAPERYKAETARLEARYPGRLAGTAPGILAISASIGLEGIIEFQDFEVIDLE